ncbi:hypothetical protein BC351_32020 [Paenibacillus ferrarius]|uniref:EamA domain-containing protein n=1 Tax=Paenibacillus ferrarius TaxID=1469647 RepID=A0A1V4HG78_9BACL|nr:hypothetical protein [Paenibacillus ferrarius]OPH53108.1 hypothetical protein BC351_32020 [Paenibacillus ferrarius]
MTYILLVAALIFNLFAQYLLKNAVNGNAFETNNMYSILVKYLSSPLIWGGAILYGCSFLFYVVALSRGELSRISPVSQALTTLGVVLISVIIFNEPLTMMKIIGLILLIVGTIIMFL